MASRALAVASVISASILFASTGSAQSNAPQLFPDKEISFDLFSQAAYGGNGQGQKRVGFTETEFIEEDDVEIEVTASRMENRGIFDSTASGGGIGINWFDGPVGFGLDYSLLSGHAPIHSTNVSLIVRKPIVLRGGESPIEIAPYAFVGGGVHAGRETLATLHAGLGLDLRFSNGSAIFLDTKYTVHDSDESWPSVRLGIRIPLGRERSSTTPRYIEYTPGPVQAPTPRPAPEPPSEREARPAKAIAPQPQTFDLWPAIDPIKKFPVDNPR